MPPVSTAPPTTLVSDEDLDNDEACMVFWKEHVRPLSVRPHSLSPTERPLSHPCIADVSCPSPLPLSQIYFEDTWDDARFDVSRASCPSSLSLGLGSCPFLLHSHPREHPLTVFTLSVSQSSRYRPLCHRRAFVP